MQGQGYNSGINPFAQAPPAINPDSYSDVQTTYMPQEEGRVPAVPSAGPPHYSSLGAAAYGQAGPPPGYVPAVGSQSDTTTVPSVSGKIGAVPGSGEAVLGKLTDASVQHNSLACLVDTSGMAGQGSPGPMPSRPDDGFFGATQQGQQSSAPAASDARPLLAGDRPPEDPNKYPFYNVRRYRPYFNISTKEVLWRVGNSFIGAFRANFMQVTQEAPDLYGPFWIATTLIFVTAVAGNYANYIEFKRSMVSPPPPLMPPPVPANSTAPSASPAVVPAAVPVSGLEQAGLGVECITLPVASCTTRRAQRREEGRGHFLAWAGGGSGIDKSCRNSRIPAAMASRIEPASGRLNACPSAPARQGGPIPTPVSVRRLMSAAPDVVPDDLHPDSMLGPVAAAVQSMADSQWFTDYTKLASSAGLFYGYAFGLSLLLWLGLRYLRSDMRLVNMFCIYGYAMTIFIPVAFICIVPNDLVQWLTVAVATIISGMFLIMNMRERIMVVGPGKSVPVLIAIFALHLGLGFVLKLIFFQY
ncbi:Yip1 domain-containing protein, partial [Haematococcus lacustris]